MKIERLADRDQGDGRLVRTAAFTFIAAATVMTLYAGRDVLIPAAVAVLFAFILGPLVSQVHRALPLSLSVAVVVLGAVAIAGFLAVLVTTQLTEVAGSLADYQTNLHRKIQDVRGMSEGGGAFGRFLSMIASLTQELASTTGPATPSVSVQSGRSSVDSLVGFVAPVLHPLLTAGIVLILVVFILLDRDHLGDQFVRLTGSNDMHASYDALADAASRVARVLGLQLLTNFGFGVAVGGGLFALGLPNAAFWGLLAGALRFIPYVGAVLGALLPALIALAITPGWLQPLLVPGWIIACDLAIGQIVEPLLFGGSTGVTPLALIMSAIFWGTLWGPVGLLLSTPLAICLLVLGKHVPHLSFLEILLGSEPALEPYQQIYHRLIRRAIADASTIALEEIERKGAQQGLDDGIGRMVVLAEADKTLDRLTSVQIDAIVEGTDEILDFLAEVPATDVPLWTPPATSSSDAPAVAFHCVGGRGQIDDAAASVIAFALRQTAGLTAEHTSRINKGGPEEKAEGAKTIHLICYASRPSDAVRRYTLRKLGGIGSAFHAVVTYDVPPTASPPVQGSAGPPDVLAGDIATICRFAAQHAVAVEVDSAR